MIIPGTSDSERTIRVEENRRSGIDRRDLGSNPSEERRMSMERRVILCQQTEYLQILGKIPIFKGLTPKQCNRILKICSKRTVAQDEVICSAGDESNEMFILIKGLLRVTFPNGKELSRIQPVGIVGEMGVFTGERRSAKVTAMIDSLILVIHKTEILKLFRYDSDLKTHVLINVIQDLCTKVRANNMIIEEMKKICSPGESTMLIDKLLSTPDEKK